MPTNEERREVARKLREKQSERNRPDVFVPQSMGVMAEILYEDLISCVPNRGNIFLALADLIEPEPERTCNVIFRSHELSQTQTALVKSCSGCGFEFGTEIKNTFPFEVTINSISIPNYCPNCGAEVIQE